MTRILQLAIPVAIMIAALIWLAPAASASGPPLGARGLPLPERRALELAPTFWQRKVECRPAAGYLVPRGALADYAPGGASGIAWRPGCEMYFDATNLDYEFATRCEIVLHEYGHLLGLEHSPDPHNVMYFQAGGAAIPGLCWQEERRWARACARKRSNQARLACELRWGV